ncbi:MAG: 50S ribosomal protein L32 [Nitrospira sp.]|nr:50S ribosomal protein L32 [Nitrospira sp.]MCB9710023.1 50S ribosomal protein L32 [Nitrospiraceae bacterium]MDR4487245.1 50S ribosomal protein L32 [Nitrospirales bacterium]MCA9464370.1 50S ribosomal protein L32 [Nitrospira sp.]MCA9475171.1 50S ribosomal protein L32 [Nitrospira sp.]
MANPKHKISRARRDSRRTHKKLTAPNLSTCPQCHEPKPPHKTCLNCGTYKGMAIIGVEEG